MFPDSRRAEQCIVSTLEDSILRTGIAGLDSHEGNPLGIGAAFNSTSSALFRGS
jgi:hypothetical protein